MNRVTTNIPCSKMLTALLLFLFVGTGMPFTTPGPMPTGMSFTTPGSMPMGMPFSAPGFMPTGQAADQNKCQLGQVYCIQSQQCVNLVASERTCDDPTCSYGQEACYDPKSKNLICVNSGTCSYHYVEFHLKTTYDALTDYGTQTDALKERFHKRLATFLSGSTKEIWGMELHHVDGDVILAFKYVKELDVEGMVADGDQVLTDMSDNNIEINYPKMSYPNVICAMDKVLCLLNGTYGCKPMDTTNCPKKHVILTLAGDFVALVSPDQYRFEEDIKRQLTRLLKAPPNAFYDFFVHQGSIIVEFSIPDENVQELLDDPSKLLLYDLSGTPLGILNIEVTSEDDGNDNGGSGGGMFPLPQFSDTCSSDQCTKCGPDQVFCALTGKCVTPNQPAETCDEDECQQGEEKCWDSTDGKYFCIPEGTCMTSNMPVRFKLGGDYFADVASQKSAWEDGCKTSLALETETTAATFENLSTRSGLIHVKTVVNAPNPTTLNAILERLDKIKYLQILGMTYDIVQGSMEYGDCIMDAEDNCIGHTLFCPENKVTCFDPAYGSGYCIAEAECTTTSILATLVLNGDTTIALADPDLFKTETGIQLPTFLSIIEVEMVDVLIFESTVNASIRVTTPLPIDLEGRIESILKVRSSSLFILGTTFRVEFVAFGECAGDPIGMCDPHTFQCAETEETCYNATTGQTFCTSVCSTTSLGVYFEALDVDGAGVTVFLSSLKLPWATALSINEAYMDMLQIQEIDNQAGLFGVSFELNCGTSAELHIQLEQLKETIGMSQPLFVNGFNVQIIAGSMMLGSQLYYIDDPVHCDADKEPCWERTSGMRQCAEPGSCYITSMPVRIGIDSTYPSDEEQFKEDYKIALQTMLSSASSSQVEVQNIQLYLDQSFLTSFLIVAQSSSDLDAVLLMLEGYISGGPIFIGNDASTFTPNTLVLGCHDNCDEPKVSCSATEVPCRDITNGQKQCVAIDDCHVTSMKVSYLSTPPSSDVEQFKQDLTQELLTLLDFLISIENMEFDQGSLMASFLIVAGSPYDLNTALDMLEDYRVQGGLPAGLDIMILPDTLQLGCHDNCGDPQGTCLATEVICWERTSGMRQCAEPDNCNVKSMPVGFGFDSPYPSDEEGFKKDFAAALQELIYPSYLNQGDIQDIHLAQVPSFWISFLIVAQSPSDLDAALLMIEGFKAGGQISTGSDLIIITPNTLVLGCHDNCEEPQVTCLATEVSCRDITNGQQQCVAFDECHVTSMKVIMALSSIPSGDVEQFKQDLSAALIYWLPSIPSVENVEFDPGTLVASFVVVADSPSSLDAALVILESYRLGGEIPVSSVNIRITFDSLQLGCHDNCEEPQVTCLATEVSCRDITNGQQQCVAFDGCHVTSMKVIMTLSSAPSGDVEQFKQDLSEALLTWLQSIISVENVEFDHGTLVASFLVVADSPSSLDAALVILESYRLGGEVPVNSVNIRITFDSLQLGCHENCDEPQGSCPVGEVPCWDRMNGQKECVSINNCHVNKMKVRMDLDISYPTVDEYTFKHNLAEALIQYLALTLPDAVKNLKLDQQDDMVVASFLIVATSPGELDISLDLIRILGEEVGMLSVGTEDISIVLGSLNLGCYDNCDGICLMTEDSCRDMTNGRKRCVAIGDCQVNSLKGSINLEIEFPTDENMFKLNLADALMSYLYPLSPVAVQNLQIHPQDTIIVASFLIVAPSPLELDAAIDMMENLEEIGVLIIVDDEIPIVKDSLDFGCHDDCDGICLMTEESCRNRQSGQKQCVAIGECQVNSLKGSMALEIRSPIDEYSFKFNLHDALMTYLSLSSPDAVQNLQLHQQGTIIVASFLIVTPSHIELDAAIKLMESLEEVGVFTVGADDIPLVQDSLDFGCHEHCDDQQVSCPTTEMLCVDRRTGSQSCTGYGLCRTTSIQVNYIEPALRGSSFEPCHKISINVAFLHEKNATRLCSLLLSLKSPNDVSVISDVTQKVQRHHDLIKATCREIDNVYQATRNNAVNMRVSIAIDGTYPADESMFKQDIKEALTSELGLLDVFMGLLNQEPFTATCVIFTDSPLLLRGAIAKLQTLTSLGSLPVAFQLHKIGCSNGDCIDPAAQCSMTEDWCPDELTCMADCDAAQSGDELDIFFIYLQLETDIVPPDIPPSEPISADNIKAQLHQLEDMIAIQLELMSIFESLKWISALPTFSGQAENEVKVWIKVAVHKDTETQESIQTALDSLQLFDSVNLPLLHTAAIVMKSPDTVVKTVFPYLHPFVAGSQLTIKINDLIPESLKIKVPESIRDKFPTRIKVICDPESGVSIIEAGSNTNVHELVKAEQNGLLSITLVHTRNDIGFVGCNLEFEELIELGHEKIYAIGLLALPAELTKLAEPKTVSAKETVIHLTEDDGCTTLPDGLFQITFEEERFGPVISDWVSEMIGRNEAWKAGNGKHLQLEMQSILVDFTMETINTRKLDLQNAKVNIDQSELYNNDQLVCRLKMGGDVLNQKGGITDLMATGENFKICPSDNFNGQFHLEITPMFRSTELPMLRILIEVAAVNDAPVLKNNFANIISNMDFFYPAVNSPGEDAVASAEFSVGYIATQLFSDDIDDNYEIGLAVLGFLDTGGIWDYKRDTSEEWIPLRMYNQPIISNEDGTSNYSVPSTILKPTDILRFLPDDPYLTWSLFEAPSIVILATDSVTSTEEEVISLVVCSHDSTKLCGPGGTSHISKGKLQLKVPRKGCDGVKNSGAVYYNSECPCGVKECNDCMNVTGGDAEIDECGICNSPADMLNADQCCSPEYRDSISELWKRECEEMEADEEKIENFCPIEGEKMSKCGGTCVSLTDNEEDQCGQLCGNNDCLDCAEVANGPSKINPCGVCKEPGNFYEDCELNIGNPHPEYQFAITGTQISLEITQNLYDMISTQIDDFTCVLIPIGSNTDSIAVPEVTGVEHIDSDDTAIHQILLTLSVDQNSVESSVGQFDISCTFADTSVTLSSIGESFKSYKRVGSVDLLSIAPAAAFFDDSNLEVTVTGTGIIDTKRLSCVMSCQSCVGPIIVPGKYIDQSLATCDLSALANLDSETTVTLYLVLDDMAISDSPPGKPVEFTIKKRPPEVLEAVIDENGCNVIKVLFDRRFTAHATDDYCQSYFSSAFDLSNAVCYQVGQHIEMHSESVPELDGAVFVLRQVFSSIGSSSSFATGQVTVESRGMNQPKVFIEGPAEIGDMEEYLFAEIENLGCFSLDLAWTVDAINGDQSNTPLSDKLQALNSKYDTLDIHQRIHIAVKASELLPGFEYLFNLAWESPIYGSVYGSTSKTITVVGNKHLKASILGLSARVDNRYILSLSAEVETDQTLFSATMDFEFEWRIEPAIMGSPPSTNQGWSIPANTLIGNTDYIVKLSVQYGTNSYQTEKTFKTISNHLITRINNYEDDTKISVAYSENYILSNAGSYDPDLSTSSGNWLWKCTTNYWSQSANSLLEEHFLPCGKFIGSEFQMFSSSEEEIILPASERRMRGDGTLTEIYKLTYTEGARSTSAKIQLNFYTPEKEIPKPKIQLPKRRKYIATQKRDIKIKARCKSVTGYIWTSTKGQQKLDIALVAKHADQISVKHNSNHHNTEKFDRCDLLLDFGQLDDAAARRILNGQNYKLTISAISEMHVVSETVTLFSYKHPEIKYFSIKSSEDSYRASETNFYVILSGLRDPAADKSTSTRLKCLYYSKQVSSHTHEQINSRFVSSDKRMKFTLQAGTYSKFKARCCSYVSGQCTTVFASDITQFTVQPVDIREEDTSLMVVQQMQMAMQMAVEIALKTVMYALLMVQEALQSSPLTPPVQQVQLEVNVKISVAIEAVLPEEDEESDVEDTRAVLKESTQLLKQHNDPQNVPKSTKSSVLRVTVETCFRFTGFYNFGGYSRRRRRETVTDQEDGEGMSTEVATEMLNSIGATFGSSTDGADKTMADLALATVKQVMVGFCQSYSEDNSSPLDAFDDIVSVRVVKKSMAGTASSQSEMVSNSKTTPAAATYGTDIESHYGQPWECKNDTSSCTDVCLAVAQVVIDFITLTATMEKTPPILHSDIILIELINPETNVEEEVTNLADPVVVTVPTQVADLTSFDLVKDVVYKTLPQGYFGSLSSSDSTSLSSNTFECMMWIDDDWDDTKCTMGIPFMTGRGQFDVTCSCSELGILGVFQTEKSNTSVFIATTSTTTSQQKPSKNLLPMTTAAACELIIDAIWETELGKATEAELISHFTNELVAITGYVLNSFKNVAIRKGSIILSFELQPSTSAGSDTLGQMLASIELLVDSGTMTITNPSGDTLTINANSFTYTEQSSEDGGSVTSASVGAIVGGVIGGIAFIALAAGAGFFVFKKTNLGKTFRPNSPAHVSPHTPDINARSIYHLPPPPSYNSLAPEKQKLYSDTKKWTENELKPWHPNEKHPRFVGNATSLEQGLVPDPEERTPTPVGN